MKAEWRHGRASGSTWIFTITSAHVPRSMGRLRRMSSGAAYKYRCLPAPQRYKPENRFVKVKPYGLLLKKFLCKNFLLANLDQPVFRLIFGWLSGQPPTILKTALQARFYSLSKPVSCPVNGEYLTLSTTERFVWPFVQGRNIRKNLSSYKCGPPNISEIFCHFSILRSHSFFGKSIPRKKLPEVRPLRYIPVLVCG